MNIREIRQALRCGRKDGLFPDASGNWDKVKNLGHLEPFVSQIQKCYEEFSKSDIKPLAYSDLIIFDKYGSRKEYEAVYFGRRLRLNTFALSAMLDSSLERIDKLHDILWQICDEYTWCLPAHLNNGIKQSVTVDLFAAETAFSLSEIMYVMGNKLDDLVVWRTRKEIFKRVLNPFMDINRTTNWEESTSNWSAVCAGSVGAAALYLIDEEDSLAAVLLRVLSALESYLEGFENDGACREGLDYWMYGFAYFTYFAALLKERTGGMIELFNSEKVRSIMTFPQKCYLSGNSVVSYSDGSGIFRHNPGILKYLKRINEDVKIPPARYQTGFPNDHCARWPNDIRNLVWNLEENEEICREKRFSSYYMKTSEWYVASLNDGTAFSTKAGHNAEPHNHNDIGSFIYHRNGENYLDDLGAGEYTKEYFGASRYSFLCNGSQGHSVPIVNGCFQSEGVLCAERNMTVSREDNKEIVSYRLEAAYNVPQLKLLKREFVFFRDTGRLTLTDEFFMSEKIAVTERFVTRLPVEIRNQTVTVIGIDTLVISYNAEKLNVNVIEDTYAGHNSALQRVYLIDFIPKDLCEQINLTFDFCLI